MAFTKGPNTNIDIELFSETLLYHLKADTVIRPWASTQFERELKGKGDSVSVQVFPSITFNTGTATGATIPESTYTVTKESIVVDQLKTLNIPIGKYEQFVANYDAISELTREIADGIKQVADTYIAVTAIAGVHADNNIATSALDKNNVFATVEAMKVKLNKANAKMDRALFLSPEVASLLALSGVYDATESGKDDRENGFIRKMSGFRIYESNNLPAGKIFGMSKGAVHFIEAFVDVDIVKSNSKLASNLLMEYVYEAKVFSTNAKSIVVKTYTLA